MLTRILEDTQMEGAAAEEALTGWLAHWLPGRPIKRAGLTSQSPTLIKWWLTFSSSRWKVGVAAFLPSARPSAGKKESPSCLSPRHEEREHGKRKQSGPYLNISAPQHTWLTRVLWEFFCLSSGSSMTLLVVWHSLCTVNQTKHSLEPDRAHFWPQEIICVWRGCIWQHRPPSPLKIW